MVRWSSGRRASACHRTARSSVPRIASVSPGVSGSSSVGYSFSLRRRQALMGRVVMVRRGEPPPPAPVHVVQARDHCAGAGAVQHVHLAPPVVDFRCSACSGGGSLWCFLACAEKLAPAPSWPCPPTVTDLSQGSAAEKTQHGHREER